MLYAWDALAILDKDRWLQSLSWNGPSSSWCTQLHQVMNLKSKCCWSLIIQMMISMLLVSLLWTSQTSLTFCSNPSNPNFSQIRLRSQSPFWWITTNPVRCDSPCSPSALNKTAAMSKTECSWATETSLILATAAHSFCSWTWNSLSMTCLRMGNN